MTKVPLIIRLAKKGSLPLVLDVPAIPDFNLASCKEEDLETFFIEESEAIARAKAICASCPIIIDCQKWGTRFAAFGVFGGQTAEERLAIDKDLPYYDTHEAKSQLSELQNSSISRLSKKYGVTPRTVSRWRSILLAVIHEDLEI